MAIPSSNWVEGFHEAIPSYTYLGNKDFRLLFRAGDNSKIRPVYFMVVIFGKPYK